MIPNQAFLALLPASVTSGSHAVAVKTPAGARPATWGSAALSTGRSG